MPAARLSNIPWFIRDWFLSRTRSKLKPDERMAYCEILWLMYMSEDGYIENDPDYLVHITGLTPTGIATVLDVMGCGNATSFTHPKVQASLEKIRRESEHAKDKAKRRWANKKASSGNARPRAVTGTGKASLKPEASGSGAPKSAPATAPLPAPSGGPSATPEPERPPKTLEEIESDHVQVMIELAELEKRLKVSGR